MADIKPHEPSEPIRGKGRITGGRIDMPAATLNLLIAFAYGVQENRIVGSPKWATTEMYDIVAKSPTPDPPPDVIRQMAQALLADRFKLVIRRETRDAPAYVLARGKRPLQMQKGDGGRQRCSWGPTSDGLQRRDCHNMTMAEFARQMPGLAYAGIKTCRSLMKRISMASGISTLKSARREKMEWKGKAAMARGAWSQSIPPVWMQALVSFPRSIVSACNWKKERCHCRCWWSNTPNSPA